MLFNRIWYPEWFMWKCFGVRWVTLWAPHHPTTSLYLHQTAYPIRRKKAQRQWHTPTQKQENSAFTKPWQRQPLIAPRQIRAQFTALATFLLIHNAKTQSQKCFFLFFAKWVRFGQTVCSPEAEWSQVQSPCHERVCSHSWDYYTPLKHKYKQLLYKTIIQSGREPALLNFSAPALSVDLQQ